MWMPRSFLQGLCSRSLSGPLQRWALTGCMRAMAQMSRRVRGSLTQQRRCAENKRFLARFEKEREVGFVMLRVGVCGAWTHINVCSRRRLVH